MQAQPPTIKSVTSAAFQLANRALSIGAQPPSKAMSQALTDVCLLLEARAGNDAEINSLVHTVKRVIARERGGS